MRSRPSVKVLLSPPLAAPGERLHVEAVLDAETETPIDYVSIRLHATSKAGVGSGKSRSVYEALLFDREWRSKEMVMTPGEHRFAAAFDVPDTLPPAYVGNDASILYTVTVHVSIPWWPDREQDFVVPVALAPSPAPDPLPKVFATSLKGPRGKEPFMELALEATQMAIGDTVRGSISLQNLGGKRVRGIDLSIVENETVRAPTADQREGRRFTRRVLDGAPEEAEAIPFRIRVPDGATPTFFTTAFQVRTFIEARADVAWGEDIVVRAPVLVAPRATEPRAERGWVAPVGRERRGLVWQGAAAKAGLLTDPEVQRMHGRHRDVTVEIGTEHRDADYWLVAKLGWPSLGLELDIGEKRWLDALAVGVVKSGSDVVDARLCAHAREHAQARAVVAPAVLEKTLPFEEVKVHDTGAVLARRGAASVTEQLVPFVESVMAAADAFAGVIGQIPPPILFAADVPAWEAFAARLRGRLELGRMWIHDAQIGTCAVEIGSVWARSGLHLGSTVHVAIDPPLPAAVSIEDPGLSPAARDAWRELATRVKSITIEPTSITVELEGKLADPQVALPILELAVNLRQALSGAIAAGPFR